jgi:hypothetical protein
VKGPSCAISAAISVSTFGLVALEDTSMPLTALALAQDSFGDAAHAVETQKRAMSCLDLRHEVPMQTHLKYQLARYAAHLRKAESAPNRE